MHQSVSFFLASIYTSYNNHILYRFSTIVMIIKPKNLDFKDTQNAQIDLA